MNLRIKVKNILQLALAQESINWTARPTGMIPESMRSFSFVSSHNHTPYVHVDSANYIESCDPKTITKLCHQFEAMRVTLENVTETLKIISSETTPRGIESKIDQQLAQEALDVIKKLNLGEN
jgi:hypothetical protein